MSQMSKRQRRNLSLQLPPRASVRLSTPHKRTIRCDRPPPTRPPPLPPPPAFPGHGFYYSLTNNFFLNARGHVVQPPSTLLPGQASVTQQQYEDLAIAQVVFLIFTTANLQ
jgi:hypothetical protein